MTPGNSTTKREYRKLIGWLSDSIIKAKLDEMKFFLGVPAGKNEKIQTPLEFFQYMEGEGQLGQNNFDTLIDIMETIGRIDLVQRIKKFQEISKETEAPITVELAPQTFTSPPGNLSLNLQSLSPGHDDQSIQSISPGASESIAEEMIRPELSEKVFTPPPFQQAEESCGSQNRQTFVLTSNYENKSGGSMKQDHPKESKDILKRYKMDSNPRGIFLIISNSDFSFALEKNGLTINDRDGTIKDVERLDKTFTGLQFDIKKYHDLDAESMEKCLEYFATLDHTYYDCFACCIMTHGTESTLVGTDGDEIQLTNVLGKFESVKSLIGKPKLFFFQACRGKPAKKPYFTKDSAPGGYGGASTWDDNMFGKRYTPPLGSDYFIGYATPPNHDAWLSKDGSWYITALCESLNKYSATDDIHHIATYTNDLVAQYSHGAGIPQIPNPTYTLRKQLYFFPENIDTVVRTVAPKKKSKEPAES
ncbi:caspase-3-like isoform X2 [Clytia hemisphaerica]|uniref:Uncharacterized protein n=2 Tax=Clytia hemisphaerica TaxID=252671 RepID=A0A7M5X6P8_9CNID